MLRAGVLTQAVLAHGEAPRGIAELARSWPSQPLAWIVIGAAAVVYARGRRRAVDSPRRQVAFWAGLTAVAVAVLSPIDTASAALASAHMVQHVLLVLIAAPLLALSAPGAALARGLPGPIRRRAPGLRRRARLDAAAVRALRSPVGRWLAYVATLWIWHSAALYGAAVDHGALHGAEHGLFLVTALAVWSVILGPTRMRVPRGAGVMLVFGLALQTVFLSALLTFAREPWYEPYANTAPLWGLSPLADQQLAGVLMWVPAGFLHVVIAVALLAAWIRETEETAWA